jgi:hypothetical protein
MIGLAIDGWELGRGQNTISLSFFDTVSNGTMNDTRELDTSDEGSPRCLRGQTCIYLELCSVSFFPVAFAKLWSRDL